VEVQRIDGITCPWKVRGWRDTFPISGEGDKCFPKLEGQTQDNLPFGPWHDQGRFTARRVMGEERYTMLLQAQTSATATFAQRRLREMRIEGFFDPQHTRSVRVRLLTYNNGLARPLLCAITIEAHLGPAGVLITRTSTASVPVVEYMPASEVRSALNPHHRDACSSRLTSAHPLPSLLIASTSSHLVESRWISGARARRRVLLSHMDGRTDDQGALRVRRLAHLPRLLL
jgi:hypothetical protein